MLSTVLECIGTAGGAGMPALALMSLSVCLCFSTAPFPSQITDKGQTAFIFKQIRSWGCCNSHMFSWLLDLKTEKKLIKIHFEHGWKKNKEKILKNQTSTDLKLFLLRCASLAPAVCNQLQYVWAQCIISTHNAPCAALVSIFRCN